MNPKYEKLAFAGVLVALGIVLPFAVSHGLEIAGTVLLPAPHAVSYFRY